MNQSENLDSPTILLRRLHRWRMAFFGLIILIAGLTIGAAAAVLVLHQRRPEPPLPPDRAYLTIRERIIPRLGLSPEQAERVGPILHSHMQRLDEIREEGRQEIVKELQAMNTEMMTVLSPEQQQQWRDLLRDLPGPFPREPGGRYGPGPKGPFGPRGGGMQRRGRAFDRSASSPNDLTTPR